MILALLCIFQVASASGAATLNPHGVLTDNPYVVNRFMQDGKWIDEVIVPGRPPEIYRAQAAIIPEPNVAAGTNTLPNVPAFDWSYGCSATSAAMMFGYYDNTGYPNIYTGPTNGGVIPMTNAVWGAGECPLSATHLGIDGRTIKGHVDDYWITYGSAAQDPFIGNWTEHTQGECTGDFMGTNQSSKSNSDGSTTFFFYTNGSPLYDYTGAEPGRRDGCHGMKLFFESRGYAVSSNYTQYILPYGTNTQGFTFENYKQEIDAGRPVMIQVEGHSMLGYGYNDSGTLVYLRDTWDYGSHSMTWGGSYSDPPMQHYAVTVFVPSSAPEENFTLLLTKSGTGTGTVTSVPAGIDCGGTCGASYSQDTVVNLTPIADTGSTFSQWTGCDSINGNVCTVTMTTEKSVSAAFTLNEYTLAATTTGSGSGNLIAPGLSCIGEICTGGFDYNTTVNIEAVATTGSFFDKWTGCDSVTDNICTVLINGDRNITASFKETYEGTIGMELIFASSGFGTKKGKVLIGGLKQKVDSWSDTSITVIVNKLTDLATDKPYDVTIQPKEPKGAPAVVLTGAFTLKKPEIDPTSTATGIPEDEITLNGMWFGTKKGKVYIGDQKCKVTSWTMNPATGVSTAKFVVHKKLVTATYFLEIENKIGKSLSFGFEVK